MTISDQPEDVESRRRSVGEWVDLAVDHTNAAGRMLKYPPLETHALYMVQQSMEAATKALARSVSMSHAEVYGHNNLNLFTWFLREVIESARAEEYSNHMISTYFRKPEGYDVIQYLQKMLSLTSSPSSKLHDEDAKRLFESALTASQKEVEGILNHLDELAQTMKSIPGLKILRKQLKNKQLSLRVSQSDSSPAKSMVRQITVQCFGQIPDDPKHDIEQVLLDQAGELIASQVRAQSGGCVVIDGNQIIQQVDISIFDAQLVNFGILIVGSLSWPHGSYPRYPAPPDAPDSLAEAATLRKIGRRHYTEGLGVIKHIESLTRKAKWTTRLLKKCYAAGCYSQVPTLGDTEDHG